jgi:rubrerythrin
MKKLTVDEVLEYSIKIEKESYDFYESSRKVLKEDELISLVTLLLRQEEEHLKSLKALLKDSQKKSYFKALINVDSSKLTQIVHTVEITEDTSPIDILNIALEREINTKNNYEMFLGLVKMEENLINTFEMLREKEEEHIRIIKRKINELKGEG